MSAAPTTPALANDAQRGSHCVQRLIGRHSWCVLHHADCLDVLPITADAVVTDPPYGIYACGGKWGKKAQLYWDKAAAENLKAKIWNKTNRNPKAQRLFAPVTG